MHRGSCLCGGVRYALDAEIEQFIFCHCQQCRKASGTAFASNAPIAEAKFRLLSGQELLSSFESSPGKQRVFCRVCGSPVYSKSVKKPGIVRIRLGSLDTPLQRMAVGHYWVSTKADWYSIDDDLPQFSE
jgi:hypothetical protein